MKKRLIQAKNFFKMSCDFKYDLLKIRNKVELRKWMKTSKKISDNEYINWINEIKLQKTMPFALTEDDKACGLFHFSKVNHQNKTCKWHFYVDTSLYGTGVGQVVEFHMIDFGFNELGFEKQNVDIVEGNIEAQRLHEKFNFKYEGYRREELKRGSSRIGVYEFGLTRSEWKAERGNIAKKIESFQLFDFKIL